MSRPTLGYPAGIATHTAEQLAPFLGSAFTVSELENARRDFPEKVERVLTLCGRA